MAQESRAEQTSPGNQGHEYCSIVPDSRTAVLVIAESAYNTLSEFYDDLHSIDVPVLF
jgi:hypothetical protein